MNPLLATRTHRPRRATGPRPAWCAVAALLALLAPAPGRARAPARDGEGAGAVVLDGLPTPVRWTDGDTFRPRSGPLAGQRLRLLGVNALETGGPVHRIGQAGPARLLALARGVAPWLASREVTCATTGRRDRYGRPLVACPEAAVALAAAGLAMAYSLDGPAEPAVLAAQRDAQGARRGIWEGGVPPLLLTSLHSVGEPGLGRRGAYDRVVDTRTGLAAARHHRRRYAPCQEVCLGEGAARSCLRYLPRGDRRGRRPSCPEEEPGAPPLDPAR